MNMQSVLTSDAPEPRGHYHQAVVSGDLVFVSGQLAILPDGTHGFEAPFAEQVRRAMANLFGILAAAGCSPGDVVKVTAYIVGVDHWPEFNEVYGSVMGHARPARSVVPVPELHFGYLVEIDAVARRSSA
jgi:2-iminobutanoate/2-iminopropanoate deaminase